MNSKRMKLPALVLAFLTLAGCVLAGCSPGEEGVVEGRWGQPVETRFLTFTAREASWSPPEGEEAVGAPEEGQYLWILVSASNSGGEALPLYYDEFDLYVGGDPRFPERPLWSSCLPGELLLSPGEEVSGYLVYLVEGEGDLLLVYDDYYEGGLPGVRYQVPLDRGSIAP